MDTLWSEVVFARVCAGFLTVVAVAKTIAIDADPSAVASVLMAAYATIG